MNFMTIFGIVTIISTVGIVIALLMLLYAVIQKTIFIPEMKNLFADLFDVGIQKSFKMMEKMKKLEDEKYETWDSSSNN